MLTGCSAQFGSPATSSAMTNGFAIQGSVYGGQFPINQAHVYLFATGTGGYGGPGIAASTANASTSLLNKITNVTKQDAAGNSYVLTNGSGAFSIGSDYTCTPGSQVYLYAVGGYTGGGTNTGAGLMGVAGQCPSAGTFSTTLPRVALNEITTVAAAYALAGFASDATHISTGGSSLGATGIANAAGTAANLATLSTGTAVSTTSSGGTAPTAMVATIADILAACVNSTDAGQPACTTLFANTESGGTTGTPPTDTATAAINLAHNPGGTAAAKLFPLVGSSAPFQTPLASQPPDFAVVLSYIAQSQQRIDNLAVDSTGRVWGSDGNSGYLGWFNSDGSYGYSTDRLSTYWGGPLAISSPSNTGNAEVWGTGFNNQLGAYWIAGNEYYGNLSGNLNTVEAIAIDSAQQVWAINYSDNSFVHFTNTFGDGSYGSTRYTGNGVSSPDAIAFDSNGNVWIGGSTSGISKFTYGGSAIANPMPSGVGYISNLAVDSSNNIWIKSNGAFQKISNSGTELFSDPICCYYWGLVLDGSGTGWTVNTASGGLMPIASSGSEFAGTIGYSGTGINASNTVSSPVVDGSGNIWVSTGTKTAYEYVGIATPVVTPLSAQLTLGLATRP